MDDIDYEALCKEIEEEMKWEYEQMILEERRGNEWLKSLCTYRRIIRD
jgi:hypothetical protein